MFTLGANKTEINPSLYSWVTMLHFSESFKLVSASFSLFVGVFKPNYRYDENHLTLFQKLYNYIIFDLMNFDSIKVWFKKCIVLL